MQSNHKGEEKILVMGYAAPTTVRPSGPTLRKGLENIPTNDIDQINAVKYQNGILHYAKKNKNMAAAWKDAWSHAVCVTKEAGVCYLYDNSNHKRKELTVEGYFDRVMGIFAAFKFGIELNPKVVAGTPLSI